MLNLTGTKATTHKNLLIAAQNTRKASPICRNELQKSQENQTLGSQMCIFENACEWPFLSVPTFRTVRRRQFLRGPPAGVAGRAGVPSVTGARRAPRRLRTSSGVRGAPGRALQGGLRGRSPPGGAGELLPRQPRRAPAPGPEEAGRPWGTSPFSEAPARLGRSRRARGQPSGKTSARRPGASPSPSRA